VLLSLSLCFLLYKSKGSHGFVNASAGKFVQASVLGPPVSAILFSGLTELFSAYLLICSYVPSLPSDLSVLR
jgi:hypothetical protein